MVDGPIEVADAAARNEVTGELAGTVGYMREEVLDVVAAPNRLLISSIRSLIWSARSAKSMPSFSPSSS